MKKKSPFSRAERQRQRDKEERRLARERAKTAKREGLEREQREQREEQERERAAQPASPNLPKLPRRKKKRPAYLRDEHGRFAPWDRRGSDEAGWVEVWSAGWQRADGSTAHSYSSLREHPDWERYYERLVAAGADGSGDPDPESEEWKRVAREIAAEVGVHVQEVYTLGLSP